MRKLLILILILCLPVLGKGDRRDDPSYQIEHDKTKGYTPTEHYTVQETAQLMGLSAGYIPYITSDYLFANSPITVSGQNISTLGDLTTIGSITSYSTGVSGISAFKLQNAYLSSGSRNIRMSGDGTIHITDAADDSLLAIANNGQVGIGTTSFIGSEKLRVNGSSLFGVSTHYSEFETDGTLIFHGDATVWDDIRITPGSFDRPGISDPAIVAYAPAGGAISTYLYEFEKDDIVSMTVQMPHGYKQGSDIYAHIHWTPGSRGNEEAAATVGWKVDYSWANYDAAFGAMATADLSTATTGTDHLHEMTSQVTITGTGKNISSMLLLNLKRTDTGDDDTWAGTISGQLPMVLEVDFHYELDTVASRTQLYK